MKLSKKSLYLLFFILIFFTAFLTFYKAFSFDFWGEDWEQIWFAVFDPPKINNRFEMQHPIVIYEELLLAKFFKFNPFYYQIIGFLLKVIGAFSVSLMMLGITKSKKAAFFTGLIFASSVGGLSSMTWVAAHASALVIPFLCIGIYFYVLKRKFILALLFLLLSIVSDPARGFFGSSILFFWEILSIIQQKKKVKESLKRLVSLFGSLISLYFILKIMFYSGSISLSSNLQIIFAQPIRSLDNLLTILGNLVVGWIIPIPQNALVFTDNNIYGKIAGYLFFFQTIFLVKKFLSTKSELSKNLLLFSVWIFVFFLPNWLFSSQEMIGYGWVLGTTHRYLTLSTVGLTGWLGVLISSIKNNNLAVISLLVVIVSNTLVANWILEKEWFYRSTTITNPIWEKINNDVPKDEKNSLFTFEGDDKLRLNQLAQAKIAFGVRRNFNNFTELPKSTSDPQLVKALICGQETGTPKIPLTHVHIWRIKGSTIENISKQARENFSKLDCGNKF